MSGEERQTRWRIEIDPEVCMGTGICAGVAPHRFRVVDGHSMPSTEEFPPDDAVWDAVESCPMEALRVRDTASGEVLDLS